MIDRRKSMVKDPCREQTHKSRRTFQPPRKVAEKFRKEILWRLPKVSNRWCFNLFLPIGTISLWCCLVFWIFCNKLSSPFTSLLRLHHHHECSTLFSSFASISLCILLLLSFYCPLRRLFILLAVLTQLQTVLNKCAIEKGCGICAIEKPSKWFKKNSNQMK